jgi:hypothetical protein
MLRHCLLRLRATGGVSLVALLALTQPGVAGTEVPALRNEVPGRLTVVDDPAGQASRPADGAAVEQTTMGTRPALELLESFDGLGQHLFAGPTPPRNPSDNSLAVGPDHIMQTVNSQIVVFSKKGARYATTGQVLLGPVTTNALFTDFGEVCGSRTNGDAVVRYDQLARRWLVVMPIFRRAVPPAAPGAARPAVARRGEAARAGQASDPGPAVPPGTPPPPPPPLAPPPSPASPPAPAPPPSPPAAAPTSDATYAMCYAVSASADPLGGYYRYVFDRPLFPDYPRPAVWPDGYYLPTSTGDEVIQKHVCIADRTRMLAGQPPPSSASSSTTSTSSTMRTSTASSCHRPARPTS